MTTWGRRQRYSMGATKMWARRVKGTRATRTKAFSAWIWKARGRFAMRSTRGAWRTSEPSHGVAAWVNQA
jgi:hypothetical protein